MGFINQLITGGHHPVRKYWTKQLPALQVLFLRNFCDGHVFCTCTTSGIPDKKHAKRMWAAHWICYDLMFYPLVNIQKAIENGHRNSEFSH